MPLSCFELPGAKLSLTLLMIICNARKPIAKTGFREIQLRIRASGQLVFSFSLLEWAGFNQLQTSASAAMLLLARKESKEEKEEEERELQ